MKLLLVVGTANDVFIYNYSKWLKTSMNITIDIFEFFPQYSQGFNENFFDNIYSVNINTWFKNIRGLRHFISPFYESKQLECFLNDKYYDIIHCHWLTPAVLLTNNIKLHCNKLYATFWGGESTNRILYSNSFLKKKISKFMFEIDYLINSYESCQKYSHLYPQLVGKCRYASFGSAPLEQLYDLMRIESKNESKSILGIENHKFCVLIGYSAKSIHQHIKVIQSLMRKKDLKAKIHLLAPMTRGATSKYVNEVEAILESSGFSYTLIRDRFLSDEEVARIRNATDITLQLSSFDGFSRSIIECLCAKSILIYSEWLNYEPYLKTYKFSGIKVGSFEEVTKSLEFVITHFFEFNEMKELNFKSGQCNFFWSERIKDWVMAYSNF